MVAILVTQLDHTQSRSAVYHWFATRPSSKSGIVKHTFETCGMFHRVECDDVNFVIRAKHGASLLALGEKIKVRVVATGTKTSKVVVESGNQFPLNIFNIGQNKQNVTTLTEFIANRVYRLCSDEEIRLREPDIRIKH